MCSSIQYAESNLIFFKEFWFNSAKEFDLHICKGAFNEIVRVKSQW